MVVILLPFQLLNYCRFSTQIYDNISHCLEWSTSTLLQHFTNLTRGKSERGKMADQHNELFLSDWPMHVGTCIYVETISMWVFFFRTTDMSKPWWAPLSLNLPPSLLFFSSENVCVGLILYVISWSNNSGWWWLFFRSESGDCQMWRYQHLRKLLQK